MPIKNESQCFTEHLERTHNFDHEKLHSKGATGDHIHYHSPYEKGENHHGNGGTHHGYTPNPNACSSLQKHSHPHEAAGNSLGMLDGGGNEIGVAEHTSSTSPFSDPGTGGDILSEMGDFLEGFVS